MKAFITAIVALVILAAGMNFALDNAGFSAAEQTSSDRNVRLGDEDRILCIANSDGPPDE